MRLRSRLTVFLFIILISIAVSPLITLSLAEVESSAVAGPRVAKRLAVDLWANSVKQLIPADVETASLLRSGSAFVSVTRVDKNNILIANYVDIYRANTNSGRIVRLRPHLEQWLNRKDTRALDSLQQERAVKYVPTGLFYHEKEKLLYVANYKGNNILVVQLRGNNIILKDIIRSDSTLGPENVFVSADGKHLVAANYDGGSITAFDLTAGHWKEAWTTPIGQAHGVCILGNKVYATGLQKRGLYELDLHDGKILRKVGELGWDPKKPEFLWPTSVCPLSSETIIVSDAHTGLIYTVGTKDLNVKAYFGGNGPTFKYLNMPYSVFTKNHEMIIASTFQSRIIVGNSDTLRFHTSFITRKGSWEYLRPKTVGINTPQQLKISSIGPGWEGYVWKQGPLISLYGRKYMFGYAALYPADPLEKMMLIMPLPGSLFNCGSYFYFMDAAPSSHGWFLFSPQNFEILYFARGNDNVWYMVPFHVEDHWWRISASVYTTREEITLQDFEPELQTKLNNIDSKRSANGLLSKADLFKLLDEYCGRVRFEDLWSAAFTSKVGKDFYSAYQQCEKVACSKTYVDNMRDKYFSEISQEVRVDLNEFAIISMLAGFRGFAQN